VLAGRVVDPRARDEIVLLQGGKRVRMPRTEVANMDLVGDRVREFCERRVRMKDSARAQWFLVEWAQAKGLPGLARAQAMLLALDSPDHAQAHEFLGHRKSPKGWLWEHDGRGLLLEQLEEALAKSPMRIAGERFAVRCDANLRMATAALLDLERLGAFWFERFGADLPLREVVDPIEIVVHRSVDSFPKWGFRSLPYWSPPPHEDAGHTFCAGPSPVRPQQLFFVGAHALLYRTMIGEVDPRDQRDRVCAWLEIGLSMHLDSMMEGPAGFAAPGKARAQDLQALQALGRTYRLTHLLHLPMYSGFYLMDDAATAINWSAAAMFVAWLLAEDNDPPTRTPFLLFVTKALAERKGDSSSAFDQCMGRRVETLEEPWLAWLGKQAGY
jgi:hypothetical protein